MALGPLSLHCRTAAMSPREMDCSGADDPAQNQHGRPCIALQHSSIALDAFGNPWLDRHVILWGLTPPGRCRACCVKKLTLGLGSETLCGKLCSKCFYAFR